MGSIRGCVNPETFVYVYEGVSANSDQFRVRIMCLREAACLPADWFFFNEQTL